MKNDTYHSETLNIAKRVFRTEIEALEHLMNDLDQTFDLILAEIQNCKGKVILTGMGKSGHIARKIAASMASLGSCSIFLHPGECMHGDLGMIQSQDLVIAFSHSGESEEVLKIIPSIRIIGARLIGITSNPDSTLARNSMITQIFSGIHEACHLGLAPTTSTTVSLVYGDALAVALAEKQGFGKKDFGLFHPAGSLGKSLTIRAIDLMQKVGKEVTVSCTAKLVDAVIALNQLGTDFVPVTNNGEKLTGIITNGSIERKLREVHDIYETPVSDLIHPYPIFVDSENMAVDALRIMLEHQVHSLPVVKEEKVIGIISKEIILEHGIY